LDSAGKPFVSILVPARNEADRILKKNVYSILAQNYPNYEVIVLNDRSTDETGEILKEIKIQNPKSKIQNLIGVDPPPGWLGKPHALEQAFKKAKGEWILSTDADIIFAPDALQTAVNYAEQNGFDALTLLPKQIFGSFWEKLFLPVFGWFCILAMPLHRVNDPNCRESMGVGNFFLLRRESLEKIGAFHAVKAEVAEDLKLAEIIKKKGFKLRIDYAPDLIETRMYAGFREIRDGFTKNLFAGMKFSFAKTFFSLISIFLFGFLPFFISLYALISGNFALYLPFFLIYLLQVFTLGLIYREWRVKLFYAWLAPLALLLFLAILANSAVKVLNGKGVKWKGRAIYEQDGVRPPPS
jgi:chlorobactene glucosyltransferase